MSSAVLPRLRRVGGCMWLCFSDEYRGWGITLAEAYADWMAEQRLAWSAP